MKESDLIRIKKITREVYNKSDTKRAIDTFLFHFKAKRIGIDDGRTFWIAELDKKVVGYIGLHQIKNILDYLGLQSKRNFKEEELEQNF